MKTASSSLIANIFGNRFVFDQDWLSGLAEKMLSTMSHDKVEEFLTDVYIYFSDRGWYNIPNVQHLPNTHVTRSGVEFYASVFSLYGNDDRFIIPRTFRPYTLWYARKTYLYSPIHFDVSKEHEFKREEYSIDFKMCRFHEKRSSLNIPFFERAKIFYIDKPYIAAGLMQNSSHQINLSTVNGSNSESINQKKYKDEIKIYGDSIDLSSLEKEDISIITSLRNDFVTEPHYDTQINKFIDFLLLFEEKDFHPYLSLLVGLDKVYYQLNVFKKSRFLNGINDLGDHFTSAAKISICILNPKDHYQEYISRELTNRELLYITKSETIWKGSLFESICGILGYIHVNNYKLLPFSKK